MHRGGGGNPHEAVHSHGHAALNHLTEDWQKDPQLQRTIIDT
ncbi:MAG: hypothetical protein ABW098_08665 [Candidatus Thiodiazotropha sp.]